MIKKILLTIVLLLFPTMVTNAITIDNIDMDVYIDNNGNAEVIEKWNAYANSDTEIYHSYYNLGNSNIILNSVSMDGKQYQIVNDWDIDATLKQKAYKAGLYYQKSDDVDICAGITSYGKHEYIFKYTITNFVLGASDSDVVYWTLYPSNNASPKNVYIKIHSDERYSSDLAVWGYGNYGGTAYVDNGYIEMNSEGRLSSDEYMTVLVKFPKNTFNTVNKTDNDFKYYYDMAEKGATEYNDNSDVYGLVGFFVFFLFTLFSSFFLFTFFSSIIMLTFNKEKYNYGTRGEIVKKDVPFFRDIPCNKDLFRAYFISNKYGLMEEETDFLGSILLKWLKDGNVQIETVEEKKLLKTKKVSNIIFNNKNNLHSLEQKLYDWMLEASEDGKLESSEFEEWCSSNSSEIIQWFDDILDYERDILINEGVIVKEKKKLFKFYEVTHYNLSDSLMDEAEQLKGLKLYLKEFTLINEKQPIEVKLWNEYLIYAQIFGIADEVAKQFEKLYPEITEQMNGYGYDYSAIYFMNSVSRNSMDSARSYSSGGGGFSSGGGGGGSFGGGGGSGSR